MRTLVIGDIHGANIALHQVLERSAFDPAHDRLISLGDIADGWPDTRQCVETLLHIPHLVAIAGNHDLWTRDWLVHGHCAPAWEVQGGIATRHSYLGANDNCIKRHRAFFEGQITHFEDEEGRLFVHAGYHPGVPIHEQPTEILAWDRKLITTLAKMHIAGTPIPELDYREVYVGHSPVQNINQMSTPLRMGSLWALDTGVKHGFHLTVMDVETKEYWQSDLVAKLYGG